MGLSSGEIKLRPAADVRAEARDIVRHFPLGGDLTEAAKRHAPELLGKVEREANQLAHEAAKESARADAAEEALAEGARPIPEYFLNMP